MNKEEFTQKALILRVGQFREIDCWVRFFSPGRGLLTAFAFGGVKSRKRFLGCLDKLNYVLFKIVSDSSGQYYYLSEGSLLQRFSGLNQDINRLGMAANCAKFLEAAHLGNLTAASAFDLLYNTLLVLDSFPDVPRDFPLFFRCRLACLYGYRPDVLHCDLCGAVPEKADIFGFDLVKAKVYCPNCAKNEYRGRQLSGRILWYLDVLFGRDPQAWLDIDLPKAQRKEAMQIADQFVQYHLGLVWQGGRFKQI